MSNKLYKLLKFYFLSADCSSPVGVKGNGGGRALSSQLTSSQNASREDADEEETESFLGEGTNIQLQTIQPFITYPELITVCVIDLLLL